MLSPVVAVGGDPSPPASSTPWRRWPRGRLRGVLHAAPAWRTG